MEGSCRDGWKGAKHMPLYDADDFDEEFVNEDEEANAFEITMSAVFEGRGEDPEAALISARTLAEESLYEGEGDLDEGKLIGEPDSSRPMHFAFTALAGIEATNLYQ